MLLEGETSVCGTSLARTDSNICCLISSREEEDAPRISTAGWTCGRCPRSAQAYSGRRPVCSQDPHHADWASWDEAVSSDEGGCSQWVPHDLQGMLPRFLPNRPPEVVVPLWPFVPDWACKLLFVFCLFIYKWLKMICLFIYKWLKAICLLSFHIQVIKSLVFYHLCHKNHCFSLYLLYHLSFISFKSL